MTKTVRDIIRHHLKRVYYNGSTDMVARQNGVIPNDTKLGEAQIEVELDQALKELEAIIRTEKLKLLAEVREQTTIFKIKAHDKKGQPHLYEAGRGVPTEVVDKLEAEL